MYLKIIFILLLETEGGAIYVQNSIDNIYTNNILFKGNIACKFNFLLILSH